MLASQRALFDIPPDICYLNAASYSPLPLRTQQAGRDAVGRKGRPWMLPASFANEQYERTRAAAARLINAEASDVALIPSISYGVATAAKLLTPPDRAIISAAAVPAPAPRKPVVPAAIRNSTFGRCVRPAITASIVFRSAV